MSTKKAEDPEGEKKNKKEEVQRFTIRNASDLQRIRLEKLMKNPAKEVIIPNRPKSKDMESAPSFVRNVMGSSAGAGSGEFHVYRHLRRKEYARLKQIEEKSLTEKLNDQFQDKLDGNKRLSDEKTAKKRAKRLKKKQNQKRAKKTTAAEKTTSSEDSDTAEEDEEKETVAEDQQEKETTEESIAPTDSIAEVERS